MDDDFDNLFKEWKLCFSKKRQRDYYFNEKTGESLWTLEEVKAKIEKTLKPNKSTEKKAKPTNEPSKNTTTKPQTSK